MRRRLCSCGRVVTVGDTCPCRIVARRISDARRPSARQRGYDSKWDEARKTFLAHHPVCQCGQPASTVDHVRPHKGDKRLFWDRGNWAASCGPCHSRKTAKDDGGFGRPVLCEAV